MGEEIAVATAAQTMLYTAGIDPKSAIAHVQAVKQIMREVMIEGTHFGVIPGCDKPSLYKAGSEVLLLAFHIAVEPKVEVIEYDSGDITYRIQCAGRHQASGILMGVGVGECSTSEEKYAWKRAVCDEEYDDTSPSARRIQYVKGNGGVIYRNKQVRASIADKANTVLKMAKKRAQIDMTLTALACSDMFSQDLEDLTDEELAERQAQAKPEKPNKYQAKEKQANAGMVGNGKPITVNQQGFLRNKLSRTGIAERALCEFFKVANLEALTMDQMNDAIKYAEGNAK